MKMSWFRSQMWRQTRKETSALVSMWHKNEKSIQSCDNQNDLNTDEANNKKRRNNKKRIRGSNSTNISRQTNEVRNIHDDDDRQDISYPTSQWSSMLPLGGREDFSPVAVPRLVSMREDDEEKDEKRRNCQLINSALMNHQASAAATTSQPRARNYSIKIKKARKRRANTMPQTASFLAVLICSLLLCLAGSLSNGQQQQSFEVQPDTKYLVQNGQEVRLRCLVRNRQGNCLWQKNGRAIGAIAKKYVYLSQPDDGDCSLVIRNVSVQKDDGQWQCQVMSLSDSEETLQSRETQLVVLVPPEGPQIKNATLSFPSSSHKQLVLEEKSPASIVCEVKGGNPMPQIEWILDGKNITKEASQSSAFLGQPQASWSAATAAQQLTSQRITQSQLRMSDIKRTMNGKNLTCVGVHQTGSQSRSVELDVQYLPSVSVPQREYSIVEGSPLSISCQVDSNPPPSEVSWRLSNDASGKQSQQPTIGQGALLNFEQTSRKLNQNTFQCMAQNSYGLSSPAEVKLNVLYPPTALNTSSPEAVSVGSEAQLMCQFEGNPRPEIRWLFTDPLSRGQPALIDNPDKKQPQILTIKNVTYRNEGEYHCEARNHINGQEFSVRSPSILLDVFGEPQFLGKLPSVTKVIQGTKSDISLTFCADPAPTRVFWHFGSMRLDVRLNTTTNTGHQFSPIMPVAHSGGSSAKSSSSSHNNIIQRFQVHPLQSLQTRNSSSSLALALATCFEAKLTILDPELTDQRDFSLLVANERGLQTGIIRLRVGSPLSPMLMITSAFVTICGLFLCSLVVIFLLKRRDQSMTAANLQNGTGSQQSGEKGAGSVEHLVNNGNNNGNTNGLLQHATQTRGIVNGTGNGLANGAANPATNGLLAGEAAAAAKLHHNLMSMASSDTSGDQKQLLTNSSSDRNSPLSGSNTNTCVDFNVNSSSSDHSTPSPLNHISVEHEFHHHSPPYHHGNHLDGSTYQPAESVTNDAELGPHSPLSRHATGALIYANLEYSEQQHPSIVTISGNSNTQQQHSPPGYRAPSSQQSRIRQQVPVDISSMAHSPTGSTSTIDSRHNSSIRRSVGHRDSLSRSSSRNNNNNNPQPSPKGRPSVGATIAMMNSLAAAAASNPNLNPNPNPNVMMNSPSAGVLNGAIQQQLASSKQIRKPGPPKPPKPSIQQRSRFYQQAAAASSAGLNHPAGGDSNSNSSNSSSNNNNQGLVMIGSHHNQRPNAHVGDQQATAATNDQLAAEYSRLAFPARAEL